MAFSGEGQASPTLAEHEGNATLPEILPARLPTNYPHDWQLEKGATIG